MKWPTLISSQLAITLYSFRLYLWFCCFLVSFGSGKIRNNLCYYKLGEHISCSSVYWKQMIFILKKSSETSLLQRENKPREAIIFFIADESCRQQVSDYRTKLIDDPRTAYPGRIGLSWSDLFSESSNYWIVTIRRLALSIWYGPYVITYDMGHIIYTKISFQNSVFRFY